MIADDEILREFLLESHENLDKLDRDFVALETKPDDIERIAAIFRTIHTIKGTSGFLGFGRLEALTHVGETLLGMMRDGAIALTPEITTALLSMVDAVRAILTSVEKNGGEPDDDYAEIRATLTQLASGTKPAAKKAAPAPAPARAPAPAPKFFSNVAASPEPAEPAAVAAAATTQTTTNEEEARAASVSDTTIRVDVALLDKLMNLVGELVLARNQILQFSLANRDQSMVATSQRLNLITTELQEGVMKTRMQPIGNVWAKFPRVVRDLALICGKQVRIQMDGKETELDRTIIEAIKDPLTHVVRNAVDHGIEAPEERRRRGKDPMGLISLRAYHAGGQVNIEVIDDGGGLDPDKIRRKAIERGLISSEQSARMTEREIAKLVFLPGFSTADRVTNVSGRGVGMDVVKTNIEKIGGTLDLESSFGRGMTLKVKIPLTLAIIPALVVTSRGERYAIPQASLLELVRLEPEQVKTQVEYLHGAPVYRLRGNLLPLVFLTNVFGETANAAVDDAVNIVVVQADGRQFGLVVDGINDTEEIVVKPLGKELKGLNVFAGATIMGDGKVALILDVVGVAQRAGIGMAAREQNLLSTKDGASGQNDNREALLVFETSGEARMAVPLSMVARLEEIPRDRIERAGLRDVVQYRGQIMQLVNLAELLDLQGRAGSNARPPVLQVIVTAHGSRSVGLVVERVVDIVEESLALEEMSSRRGVRGAAVVQGKVTELLDVPDVLRAANPRAFEQAS